MCLQCVCIGPVLSVIEQRLLSMARCVSCTLDGAEHIQGLQRLLSTEHRLFSSKESVALWLLPAWSSLKRSARDTTICFRNLQLFGKVPLE